MAGPTVEFLGYVPSRELPALYAGAQALFFPQYEDAGLVLLEAQACGTPGIAYGVGGALDAIKEHVTGMLFAEQSLDSLRMATELFLRREWDRSAIREHAQNFSRERFRARVLAAVDAAWKTFSPSMAKRNARR
jgi:glycosyltransferase involved in cell wall biosynthesis